MYVTYILQTLTIVNESSSRLAYKALLRRNAFPVEWNAMTSTIPSVCDNAMTLRV